MKLKKRLLLLTGLLLMGFIVHGCNDSDEGTISTTSGTDTTADTTGTVWTEVEGTQRFSTRAAPAFVSFDNKMWIVGGYDGSNLLNDVWYSTDGSTWTEATDDAAFSPRVQHSLVVLDSKMWLIAGLDASYDVLNDVWSSSDGITWTLSVASAPFSARQRQHVVGYNSNIWLYGGEDASGDALNDVWYSNDGTTWTRATASADYPAREHSTALVWNDALWMVGGWDGTSILYDSWSSTDGVTWTQGPDVSQDLKGYFVVFDDKIFVVGGQDVETNEYFNEVWRSTGMDDWEQLDVTGDFTPQRPNLLVHDEKLWIIGGEGQSNLNEVWYTE